MECIIKKNGTTFEATVSIKNVKNSTSSNSNIYETKSNSFLINDVINIKFKYMSIRTDRSNGYSSSNPYFKNLFYVQLSKVDKTSPVYHISFSVPELNIINAVYIVDGSGWRLLSDASQVPTEYTVKVRLENVMQLTPFAKIFDDDKITDFELKGEDGSVKIHKAVVAAVSPDFKSRIENLDEAENCLTIPETKVKTIQIFKVSIYKNILPEDDNDLLDLLLLASVFKMKWLEYKCVDKILSHLTAPAVLKMLDFAFQNKLMTLFLGILEIVQSGDIKVIDIRKHYLNQ